MSISSLCDPIAFNPRWTTIVGRHYHLKFELGRKMISSAPWLTIVVRFNSSAHDIKARREPISGKRVRERRVYLAAHERVFLFGGSIVGGRQFAGGWAAESPLGWRWRRRRPLAQLGVEVLERLVRQARLPFGPHRQRLLELLIRPVLFVMLNWKIHFCCCCCCFYLFIISLPSSLFYLLLFNVFFC